MTVCWRKAGVWSATFTGGCTRARARGLWAPSDTVNLHVGCATGLISRGKIVTKLYARYTFAPFIHPGVVVDAGGIQVGLGTCACPPPGLSYNWSWALPLPPTVLELECSDNSGFTVFPNPSAHAAAASKAASSTGVNSCGRRPRRMESLARLASKICDASSLPSTTPPAHATARSQRAAPLPARLRPLRQHALIHSACS